MTRKHQALSYRHFERSEKSLSFTAHRSMFGNLKRETCSPRHFRASPYLYSAALLIFMRRTTIPHSSFEQSFHSQSMDGAAQGANPLYPYCRFPVILLY